VNKKTAPPRILVAGIPGAGKTEYCDWLEQEKGFLHLDIDELSKGNGAPIKLELLDCLRHSAERFLGVIAKMEKPILIDWGFPAYLIAMVACLHANGFAIWWFDGDREAARQSFIRRATVPVESFDAQMKSIEEHRPQIHDLFEDNVIYSVSAGPAHRAKEDIYKRMFSQRRALS
jgi:hypothetical protein